MKAIKEATVSVVIPAKNEREGLGHLLPQLRKLDFIYEVIVVDDGSTDDTASYCESMGVKVVRNMYSKGNGAAIKAGARTAKSEIVVFMDADGQHEASDVIKLVDKIRAGFDMAVGSRDRSGQASPFRFVANNIYNILATWMVEQKIHDLTSGFRAVRLKKFKQYIHLLPNGFSYPSTITMAFFRAGYSVCYIPVNVKERKGVSHIRPLKDGFRFLLIIFKIGTLYSPLKFFVPISMCFFLVASGYYSFTFFNYHRFTNMSALLYITSVLVFLIGLVSEQVAGLQYSFMGESSDEEDSQ